MNHLKNTFYHIWDMVVTAIYHEIGNPYVTSLGPDTFALLGWKSIMAHINFTNKSFISK